MKPFETFFALLGALAVIAFCATVAHAGDGFDTLATPGARDLGLGLLPAADHVQPGAGAPQSWSILLPLGAWAVSLLKWATQILVAAATGAFALYAPPIAKLFVSNDAIARAVEVAIAAEEGLMRGQKMEVTVTNRVAADALNYIVANEPLAARWFERTVGSRIISYLSTLGMLPPEAIAPP